MDSGQTSDECMAFSLYRLIRMWHIIPLGLPSNEWQLFLLEVWREIWLAFWHLPHSSRYEERHSLWLATCSGFCELTPPQPTWRCWEFLYALSVPGFVPTLFLSFSTALNLYGILLLNHYSNGFWYALHAQYSFRLSTGWQGRVTLT